MKPNRGTAARFVIGLLVGMATTRVYADQPIVLNPAPRTYDNHPSMSTIKDGKSWVAWHTYRAGADGIDVCRIDHRNGGIDARHSIGGTGSVHGPPTIVADSRDHAWVVWSAKLTAHWHVVLREWTNGRWGERHILSDQTHDAIFPTAALAGAGTLSVAWSERVGEYFRIRGCLLQSRRPIQVFDISDNELNAYRPVLTRHGSELWSFWDQYHQRNYSIQGRRILPALGQIEQVSPADEYCLTPTAVSHSNGLHVAWLRKIDVVGGPGVISQWHTLHAAIRRQDNQWCQVVDASGRSEGAELTHGLMAKIAPQPIATGGYLGSRVRPMLHSIGDQVWLLWERKSDHRGSTPKVSGDLVGRPIRDGAWQTSVLLHDGYVDYHVTDSIAGEQPLVVVASRLPRQAKRIYERFSVDFTAADPFEQEAWAGWNPIMLPIESEQTPRHKVEFQGKRYMLYWGDLHCHSNLSADAEGETDELNHYARDRAGLDVVVFTNNDFYNVPLTQYEYELGNLFAASHSVEGEFISLPGFEWTSRIPDVANASLSDPRNWLPPYQNRSYANHRSVIYPAAGGPLVHFTEVGNDISKLNAAVADAGGITLSQHPTFKLSGHAVEVGLELTSGWSNYIARNPKLFHESLDQGLTADGARLGFVANGDSHRRAPGLSGALTGIYADALTPVAILDALRARRCFATSGSRIFVDARAGDSLMGQVTRAERGRIRLTLHAIGTRAITSATLIRNGKAIFKADGSGQRDFQAEFTDETLPPGYHWYYWQIAQAISAPVLPGNLMAAHGHLAWSSPHWVLVE